MNDAIGQFKAAMHAAGLEPPEVIEAGKLNRFPTNGKRGDDAGWCKLFADLRGGVFGDHRSGLSEHWQAKTGPVMTAGEREAFQRMVAESKHQAELEERKRHEAAALKAVAILDAATGDPATHPYAVKKRVPLGSLVKRGPWPQRGWDDALLVPIYGADGRVWSIEAINADGVKCSLKDANKRGGFYPLGRVCGASRVFIAEGVANAAVGAEVDKSPAVAAMGKSNILHVALAVRDLVPDAELIILADNDLKLPKEAHEAAVAVGGRVVIPELDGRKCDLWDVWNERSIEAVRAAIANAKPPARDESQLGEPKPPADIRAVIEAAISRLDNDVGAVFDTEVIKALKSTRISSPADYQRYRKRIKDKGASVAELDRIVCAGSKNEQPDTGQGQAFTLEDPELWPESVDGGALVQEIAATIDSYVLLRPGAPTVLAFWIMHAHCYDVFCHTPRLNVTGPQKRCGKTALLDVIEHMSPRALRMENLTTAVFFRLTERYKPTFLIDEYDRFLPHNEELLGALNAGHKRGGQFARCEGDSNEVRLFNVFCPTALAGIGPLPAGTLTDRSIVIQMTRAREDEIGKRFDGRYVDAERTLAEKAARWVADHKTALSIVDPPLPDGFYNRKADNWRPLFSIAAVLGGEWPQKLTEAALAVIGSEEPDETLSIQLLRDIRGMFQKRGLDRLRSQDIVEALGKMEDQPWFQFGRTGKPITQNAVARLLKPFGVHPKQIWFDGGNKKGYELESFVEVFSRFLEEGDHNR